VLKKTTMPSARAMFPAVDSTLSVDELVDMFMEVKTKHAQRNHSVVNTYVDLLLLLQQNIAANYINDWVHHMDNALSSVVVLRPRLLSDESNDQVAACLTTTVALSLLVKRAETNDIIRRKSVEIVNSPRFPFVIPANLKQFVIIFVSAVNMFWVAFDQIRAVESLNMELGKMMEESIEEMLSVNKIHCIWVSNMIALDMSSRKRTLLLDECLIVTEEETVNVRGRDEIMTNTVILR